MLGGSNSDKKDAAGSIRQKCLYTPNIFLEKYKSMATEKNNVSLNA